MIESFNFWIGLGVGMIISYFACLIPIYLYVKERDEKDIISKYIS